MTSRISNKIKVCGTPPSIKCRWAGQRIEPTPTAQSGGTVVELLTVINAKFKKPNASRDPLRNIRFFYCG